MRRVFRDDHELFRDQVRRFIAQESRHTMPPGKGRRHAGFALAPRGRGRPAQLRPARALRPGRGLRTRGGGDRGTGPRQLSGHRLFHPFGHGGALRGRLRHRGAESALAACHDAGRADRRAGADRARRRQRPEGDPLPRRARRRPLRAQRPEDLHHQRRERRPGHRAGQHRARSGARGCRYSASRPDCPATPRARRWTRSASTARTPASCSSTTCACPPTACWDKRTRPSNT